MNISIYRLCSISSCSGLYGKFDNPGRAWLCKESRQSC